jgi:hypothetical protein
MAAFDRLADSGRSAPEGEGRLFEAALQGGKVFVASSRIDGVNALRLAVLIFHTLLEQAGYRLNLLRESVGAYTGTNRAATYPISGSTASPSCHP